MKVLFALIALLSATACGFQPVYSSAGASDYRGNVDVLQIDGRSGHFLRKALLREIGPGLPGLESGILSVEYEERINRLQIRGDAAAARSNVNTTSQYVLETGEATLRGELRSTATFTAPEAEFADISAQVDASERAMDLLARRIVDDIRIKLARQASQPQE